MKGTVNLYYRDGEIVATSQYNSFHRRETIIEKWKTIYAVAYENTYLQFAPDVNSDAVNEDGTNKVTRSHVETIY